MKILIAVSNSFCANFIKGQGAYLMQKGQDVIIVSGPGEEIDNLERNEPVKVIRMPFNREISLLKDLKNLIGIIKLVRKEKPDIINAGNPKTGFLFSLAHVFFWHIPLIFTLRGIRSDTLVGFKKRIVKLTERITCLFANEIIAISPSLKQHAIDIGLVTSKKCKVLSRGSSNGIDLNYFSLNSAIIDQGKAIMSKYNIPYNSFKLLFVGRVTKDKGVIELLEALKICLCLEDNIHLIIAGPIEKDDPVPNEYYKMIESHPNVHYLGKQIDIRPIYSFGNALVLFSHREGFGNVVIEASSFGIPTIVADIPGLRDTTEHENTGLLVPAKDSKSLSHAILRLYNDREWAINLGQQGQNRVKKYFGNELVWSKQLETYISLCKKSSSLVPPALSAKI